MALVQRGTCLFAVKVLNAQNAGAVAAVVVNNRTEALAVEVAAEIVADGGTATADGHSVASDGEMIIEHAVATYGRIDILVNNAGQLRDRSFAKMTWEE